MIQSMTGYGRAEVLLKDGKLIVEIRSVNGKTAEISIKTSLLPKDKEMPLRKKLADRLQRGTIDVFLTWEPNAGASSRLINRELALDYYRQIEELARSVGTSELTLNEPNSLISTLLRMPDVLDTAKRDVITPENWPQVEKAFDEALEAIVAYRRHEGEALYKDVRSRVDAILALEDEVESCEAERIVTVRERLQKTAEDLGVRMDAERFEQEMIFYLEKYDINEEKVRLRQHCRYFLDTMDSEEYPGKKLGFIIQEMGREINTTGSKANHARIQKAVVRMKDELEKIREQSMNIL
ncbi:MAG: YicC family protein [Bacteroidales bacterium]|nr:YicC family protein [Bacteroidales bacterium]